MPLFALLLAMLAPAAAFATDDGGDAAPDQHCANHDSATKISGTQTIDGVTITVSGATVSVEGGSVDFCVKAGTDNSGPQSLSDGNSYTVGFDNDGGQTPAVSYVAVYSVTPAPDTTPEVCEWDDALTADDDECVAPPVEGDDGEADDRDKRDKDDKRDKRDKDERDRDERDRDRDKRDRDKRDKDDDEVGGDDEVGDDNGADEADYDWRGNVDICHRTASVANPYVAISPSISSIVRSGHGNHAGPVFHEDIEGRWGDIIPAFSYLDRNGEVRHFDGVNWPEGQDVFEAGCTFSSGDNGDDGDTGDTGELAVAVSVENTEVCLGDEVAITIVNDSDTAITITGLLTLPGGSTMPVTYQVDADSTSTHTDTPVLEGTHTIQWYAFAEGYDATAGTVTFTAVDCDDDSGPVDGDDTLGVTVTVATDDVCLGDEVVTTVTNTSDVTVHITGTLTLPNGFQVALNYLVDADDTYTNTDTPVLAGVHTIQWHAAAEGYDAITGTTTFTAVDCATDDGSTPPVVTPPVVTPPVVTPPVDTPPVVEDDEVLGEVIDQPETEQPEVDAEVEVDDTVREDDDVVLDTVIDGTQDGSVTVGGEVVAGGTVGGDAVLGVTAEQLPRTGVSVLGVVLIGLLSLFSGAGLLRRRS